MKTIFTIIISTVLFACSNAESDSGNGTTYLRTLYTAFGGGSLTISWIYLGNDGTIVYNPKHGVNPVDMDAEKGDNSENVGTYKIEDEKIKITWSNNKTDEWSIEKKDGEISIIDGGITTVPNQFKEGETIQGSFSAMALGGSFSRVQTMTFRKDGTFGVSTSTAVNNDYVSEIGKNSSEGTYKLNGNTLRMKFDDGNEQVANIAHWKEAGEKLTLVINNSSFPQEN